MRELKSNAHQIDHQASARARDTLERTTYPAGSLGVIQQIAVSFSGWHLGKLKQCEQYLACVFGSIKPHTRSITGDTALIDYLSPLADEALHSVDSAPGPVNEIELMRGHRIGHAKQHDLMLGVLTTQSSENTNKAEAAFWALAGAFIGAAQRGTPCLVSGYPAALAAFEAVKLNEGVADWLLFAQAPSCEQEESIQSKLNSSPIIQSGQHSPVRDILSSVEVIQSSLKLCQGFLQTSSIQATPPSLPH